MAEALVKEPCIKKELSHLGAVSVTAAELRTLALTKKRRGITIEANTNERNVVIFRCSKDLGNAFYADWVNHNLPNIGEWHNADAKGIW